MLTRIFFPYRLLGLFVLGYAAIVALTFELFEVDAYIRTSSIYVKYSFYGALIILLFALLIQTVKLLLAMKDNPTRELIMISKRWLVTNDRWAHMTTSYLLFVIMLFLFSTVKSTLPQLVPFTFDELFHRLDRVIFLGNDPYSLLLPIFGGDFSLWVLNSAYQLWLLLVVASMLWLALTHNHSLRLQYLFACLLSFAVAGNLAAVLLSSAGPCYFELINGGKEYQALFQHLREVHERTGTVYALIGQEVLWQSYISRGGLISGISAMPSMHIVFTWLWVFMLWDHRTGRTIAFIYAIAIYVGSIVLGWHYAVDGIVGFALAIAAWSLAGPLAKRSLRQQGEAA